MKDKITICYLDDYLEPSDDFFNSTDLVIFGKNAFSELNYKRELKGIGETFYKMKDFSVKISVPCLFSLKTDDFGKIKKSAMVFERGKLLSVCEANLTKEKESPSFGYKVIKTSIGKLGVAVSDDIKNPDCLKALCLCGGEIILNLYAEIFDFNMQSLISSLAYLYGVPVISCGAHGVVAVTSKGKIEYYGNREKDRFCLQTKRFMREVVIKTYSN